MTHGQLQIHSENILPIIKKWLYSDKDIFVRELVSNACDASHKLQVLREEGQAPNDDEPLRVVIAIDKEARTLTFSDHGLGMDAAEVEKYICQLAFSGAEDSSLSINPTKRATASLATSAWDSILPIWLPIR